MVRREKTETEFSRNTVTYTITPLVTTMPDVKNVYETSWPFCSQGGDRVFNDPCLQIGALISDSDY